MGKAPDAGFVFVSPCHGRCGHGLRREPPLFFCFPYGVRLRAHPAAIHLCNNFF